MRTAPPSPSQFNAKLPQGASAAILKAMAKVPGERFASCSEFAEALAAGFEGSRVVSIPASARAPLSPLVKISLGALVLGGLGAGALWLRGSAGQPGPLVFQAARGDSSEVQLRSLDGTIRSLGEGKSPHFGPGPGQVTLLRGGDLMVVDLASKKATRLADSVGDFDVSPMALVFVSKGLKKWPMEQGKVKGKPVPLADEGSHPCFSPDGSQVAFAADRAIWVIDTGGRRHSLSSPAKGETDQFPCWSPDGGRVVFVRRSGKESSLHIIRVEGSGKEQIVPSKGPDPLDLSWAPNAKIAFAAAAGIYSINPDGSQLSQLIEAPKGVTLGSPDWGIAKP